MLICVNYMVRTRHACLTVFCLKNIAFRDSVKTLFGRFVSTDSGCIYTPEEEDAKLPVDMVSLDLRYVEFVSRAAMDEILCQADRIGCPVKLIHCKQDIRKLYHAVRKTH